jgi:hypothetical protein
MQLMTTRQYKLLLSAKGDGVEKGGPFSCKERVFQRAQPKPLLPLLDLAGAGAAGVNIW